MPIPIEIDEPDEALFWEKREDSIAEDFERTSDNGTLERGTTVRKGKIPTTTIRLDPVDIAKAKIQAEFHGLKYQTYIKMLIHEALKRKEKK